MTTAAEASPLRPATVIATAGHVDHGKSTLVKALTGTDPDRWPEERARGLTIDLGYAHATLPNGAVVSFVDVPGHARFIKNMLAGVGSVRACLFVVAASEGWKEQTEEHLHLLELLGVDSGIVALTKADAVDIGRLSWARHQAQERLRGTFLERAKMVTVAAPTGEGIEELLSSLEDLVARAAPPPDLDRPRLWVDRCFSARGAGAVVTGTLSGGNIEAGQVVELVPGTPPHFSAIELRVRGLQIHGQVVGAAPPGQRVAVNLSGTNDVYGASRGRALVKPGQWEMCRVFDATFSVLSAYPSPLSRRGNYRVHFGTAHLSVSVRPLGTTEIPPGGTAPIRVHLPGPYPLVMGDRFVLRDGGRNMTIGGGEILDVAPVLPAKKAFPDKSVARVVAERGWVEAGLLERLTGARLAPQVGRWVVSKEARQQKQEQLEALLRAAGPLGVEATGVEEKDRALLATMADVRLRRGRYILADAGDLEGHDFVAALRTSLFDPPSPAATGVGADVLRGMATRGLAVNLDGVWFHPEAVRRARQVLSGLLANGRHGFTVSEFRQALPASRRVAMALLAHFDAAGDTRRQGDYRLAGPALARELEGRETGGRETGDRVLEKSEIERTDE